VALEGHAEQVEDLALVPVRDAPYPLDARHARLLARQVHLQHEGVVVGVRIEVVDDLEARRRLLRIVDRRLAHEVVEGQRRLGLRERRDVGDRVGPHDHPRVERLRLERQERVAEARHKRLVDLLRRHLMASGAIWAPARLPSV
jgi:hypothetical protein